MPADGISLPPTNNVPQGRLEG